MKMLLHVRKNVVDFVPLLKLNSMLCYVLNVDGKITDNNSILYITTIHVPLHVLLCSRPF